MDPKLLTSFYLVNSWPIYQCQFKVLSSDLTIPTPDASLVASSLSSSFMVHVTIIME